nr:MAG TPA: hypothetical protein [Caudoviricetes sp.]
MPQYAAQSVYWLFWCSLRYTNLKEPYNTDNQRFRLFINHL